MRHLFTTVALFILCNSILIEYSQASLRDTNLWWKQWGLSEEPWKVLHEDPVLEVKHPSLKPCLDFVNKSTSPSCGPVTVSHILEDKPFKDPCCNVVMAMGKECHDRILSTLFTMTEFVTRYVHPEIVWNRSEQLWNHCVERKKRYDDLVQRQNERVRGGGQVRA